MNKLRPQQENNIQSVLLAKKKFSLEEAKQYLKKHKFKIEYNGKGVHETEKFYRFRQRDVEQYNSFYSEMISPGVVYIIGVK